MEQTSLYTQRPSVMPYTSFEMMKMFCNLAHRDFDQKNTPICMRVYTDKGCYTFPANNPNYCFKSREEI